MTTKLGGDCSHPCGDCRWEDDVRLSKEAPISTRDLKMALHYITDVLVPGGGGKDKMDETVLVFLPTYLMLEAMYRLVPQSDFSVYSLHSSIDLGHNTHKGLTSDPNPNTNGARTCRIQVIVSEPWKPQATASQR